MVTVTIKKLLPLKVTVTIKKVLLTGGGEHESKFRIQPFTAVRRER